VPPRLAVAGPVGGADPLRNLELEWA
jgi:hypothetical protein